MLHTTNFDLLSVVSGVLKQHFHSTWSTLSTVSNKVISGTLVVVSSRQVVDHGLLDIVRGKVVARNSGISPPNRCDTGGFESGQHAIKLLSGPFLSDSKPEFVHVQLEVAIQLANHVGDDVVLSAFPDATVEESLEVFDVVEGHVDSLVLGAMFVDQAVIVDVPIIQASLHGDNVQTKLLEQALLAGESSIMAPVPWQVNNHTVELAALGHVEHLEALVRRHDTLQDHVVSHFRP